MNNSIGNCLITYYLLFIYSETINIKKIFQTEINKYIIFYKKEHKVI